MRKYRRYAARRRMEKAGIQHINRPNPKTHKSYFAENWRRWA